jgi:Skp family chaperone for outer membrane proteins
VFRGTQTPNTLDLILSSSEDLVENVHVMNPVGKSHHGMVACTLKVGAECGGSSGISFKYDKGNYISMAEELDLINWEKKFKDRDTQECWDIFQGIVTELRDKWIPLRRQTIGNKKTKPLWMNEKALAKVKKKHAAWRRYLQTRDGEEYAEYCKARNQARNATRRAVSDFEKQIAQEAKKNPKAFYRYVQSKTKSRTGIGDLDTERGPATTDEEKAQALNNFFASVFVQEDQGAIPDAVKTDVPEPLLDFKITPEMVIKKLKKQNPCKSPGEDGIHPRILKELANELAAPLCTMFNLSLSTSTLPTQWKEACITPIYKKGPRRSPGNYRPVSLTSIVCKIMESIVRDKVIQHMKENKLLSDQQHGFMSGRSCMTQLTEVMEEWTEILDNNRCIDAVYFDFMKAFDSVPHRRLLNKIRAYGIDGNIAAWIQAFLTGRRQRVSVNNSKSTWLPVVSGVPQGSVLGPVLFIIYINDLPDAVENTMKLFADDTKLYSRVDSTDDCHRLQQDIDSMQDWSAKWLLSFHPEKCKVMRLGSNHPNHTYQMHNRDTITNLQFVQSEKDLGVTFDNKLKFREHINNQVSKANRLVGMIRRSFTYLAPGTFSTLFKTIVRPHLEYGYSIWAPSLKKDKDLLENVQRRATKLVPGLRSKPYEERLEILNMPTLEYRRKRGEMIEAYKYLHGHYQVAADWLRRDLNSTTRGHPLKLKKMSFNTEIRRNSMSNRIVNNWNALPTDVVLAPSVDSFKGRLDKHWGSSKFQEAST